MYRNFGSSSSKFNIASLFAAYFETFASSCTIHILMVINTLMSEFSNSSGLVFYF